MLTTESAKNTSENVVTDENANVFIARRDNLRTLSPEAAILLNKSIVARPLLIPEIGDIEIKRREYSYRWVSCHGEHGGRIYQQRKAMGYTNATPDDAEVKNGETIVTKGEIRNGDLILMKILRERYWAHLKYNMERSLKSQRMRGVYMKSQNGDNPPSSDVWSDDEPKRVSVSNEPGLRNTKVSPFIPANPDELFERSENSKNATRVRAEMKERRDIIAQTKEGT